ncbi:pyrroline-5-carboxylate reductase [Hydrogenimonas cancrithermarum]|uniref:Pyrroline-5-carboxylate reductase n=1 Tax=Hydrogenimonas cancrithermarum TaxID=2993563 RepID=A0ABN6WWG8_9BACT|nr:pyrroline-5-carboxylate reductase [Hydrogenimonas cancrithermarum]BDY13505.1 pyrroline-5-carboxylate reductase [Hydrogenimonas cancrithermarum]
MKLTIVGPGKMALALAKGLEKEHELTIVGRDGEKLLRFTKQLGKHAKTALLDKYEIDGQSVILCVKPYALKETAAGLKGKAETLYSVLAGTGIAALKKAVKAENYVRAMPNLAAEFFSSMTTLTGDGAKKEEAERLFTSIGQTLWVETEKELDIATAVAGSGPAYLALVAEALADGGVKEGLKRADAMKLVEGLFAGFAPLLSHSHPALLKDGVMSPGGTTAAGYAALEKNGTRAAFIEAVEKAYRRTLPKA